MNTEFSGNYIEAGRPEFINSGQRMIHAAVGGAENR